MGSPDIRAAFLAYVDQSTHPLCHIDINNVLITSGAKHAICLAFLSMVRAGDKVLLPNPGWPLYAIWTSTLGAEVSWYDASDACAEMLIREIRSGSFSHVVINSPNNPTGIEYAQDVINLIAESAREAKISILSDEVYRCFSIKGGTFLPHVSNNGERVIVADSLSKFAGAAGLRLGFLVGGQDTVDAARTIRAITDSCPPGIIQPMGTYLLSAYADDFRDGIRKRGQLAVARLVELLTLECIHVESSGAIYLWVLSDNEDGRLVISNGRVLRGIPGRKFGKPGYVRLCPVTDDPSCTELLGIDLSFSGVIR
ncbi:MAG: pyridoxal phosphate-dependent aminotransferase [Symploca sp. SIO1B1]|nr:pyridoxal phosphate-dependent aminotransferase [Symploca sp. SIO1B1]